MFLFFSFPTWFGFSFSPCWQFYCIKSVIFLSTVSRKHLFPFATFFFSFFLYCLTGYTPHHTTGAVSPKYTLQICLFLLIIFAPAKAPMTFKLSSSFPAENLTSKEAFLLSLFFSYFTACFSMSLSLFSTTKTTPSKVPLCLFSSSISRDSPHWISHKERCNNHETPRNPCHSDEKCIGTTCAESGSTIEPLTSIVNSAAHVVSSKDSKLSTDSCRENKSWKGSPGASHCTEASKR